MRQVAGEGHQEEEEAAVPQALLVRAALFLFRLLFLPLSPRRLRRFRVCVCVREVGGDVKTKQKLGGTMYYYVCVRILVYMCPHATICVRILVCMCPHTTGMI